MLLLQFSHSNDEERFLRFDVFICEPDGAGVLSSLESAVLSCCKLLNAPCHLLDGFVST